MIKLIKSRKQWLLQRSEISESLGLVPTMGNLHLGHLSLAQKALDENKHILVTIFVNPKQFGPNEDFERYPRTLEQDLELLSGLKKNEDQVIYVFAPASIEEIYPIGFSTTISVKGVSEKLCGLSRPGHFDGVTTVVYQLFALARAQKAYFGQKDYQQYKVIEKMVHDLCLDIELLCCPIIRDQDGLALSSRNQYLSADEKKAALILSQTLQSIQKKIEQGEFQKIDTVELKNENSSTVQWDYLEILDGENLNEISSETKQVVALGAINIGKTRLIDNLLFPLTGASIVR
jgi:pantoate--beta-alanine ligase